MFLLLSMCDPNFNYLAGNFDSLIWTITDILYEHGHEHGHLRYEQGHHLLLILGCLCSYHVAMNKDISCFWRHILHYSP